MAAPQTQRTGNQALVREINLAAIMNHLHSHAPISRAALAEKTAGRKVEFRSVQYVEIYLLQAMAGGGP